METPIIDICTFKRGGWCIKCEKFAIKVLEVKRTWEKQKTGLFGHKLRKKVSWKCVNPVFQAKNSSDSDVRDTTLKKNSNLGGAGALQVGNFTEGGREAGCASLKRQAANSCEPRSKNKKARLRRV